MVEDWFSVQSGWSRIFFDIIWLINILLCLGFSLLLCLSAITFWNDLHLYQTKTSLKSISIFSVHFLLYFTLLKRKAWLHLITVSTFKKENLFILSWLDSGRKDMFVLIVYHANHIFDRHVGPPRQIIIAAIYGDTYIRNKMW